MIQALLNLFKPYRKFCLGRFVIHTRDNTVSMYGWRNRGKLTLEIGMSQVSLDDTTATELAEWMYRNYLLGRGTHEYNVIPLERALSIQSTSDNTGRSTTGTPG